MVPLLRPGSRISGRVIGRWIAPRARTRPSRRKEDHLFSFFRKKSRADDATKAKFVDAITSFLSLQLFIVPNPSIEDTHGKINRKAIAYIYGYIDAFLRTRGYDMADTDIAVPVAIHVLRKLFRNY